MSTTGIAIEHGFYVTGGTLRRDAPSYVERQADQTLYEGLLKGEFCYILTSRQMGKSSLMVRTAARLREDGVGVAVLDLTAIGQNLTAEQWYDGLLGRIGQQLQLEGEVEEFWLNHQRSGPLQRWINAITEVVLPRYPGRLVIFVDEIDTVRSLPFSTDEFFAGIREFYNRRTEAPELERLTFCLLGVAAPSDLIRDTRTTPFNIGRRIELNDFTEAEAAPLTQGLQKTPEIGTRLLERVLYWTGGHPYLTQRLCQTMVEEARADTPDEVDRLCEGLFLSRRAQERDDNLLFVRERMLRSEVELASLLSLYAKVGRGKRVRDDVTNPLISILGLSGVTRVAGGYLRVRNRIYERVFDQEWVKMNMPDAELRRQRAAFRRGLLRATAIAAAITAVMAVLVFTAIQQRNRAAEQELTNRRLLYAAHMNLAHQAWETADIDRMEALLPIHLPQPGQEDMRGFEWYYLWRLSQRFRSVRHADWINSIAFSPDGKTLATGSADKTVKLWDMATRRELMSLKHPQIIQMVRFSPDGQLLATGGNDQIIRLWDVATGRELATIKGHSGLIWSVAFSPDGKRLASGSRDYTVRLWDITTKQELAVLRQHEKGDGMGFPFVAFSPDGKFLVTRGPDNIVKVWDVATRRELVSFKERAGGTRTAAFSPDGRTLAMTGLDYTVRLCEVGKWEETAVFKGHTSEILAIAFSPDGKRLVSGSDDRTVKLWDVTTAKELTTLRGHAAAVTDVVFSPDGRMIVSGSRDWRVIFWEPDSNRESPKFEQPRSILSVAFSPDGKRLVSGSEVGTIRIWDVAIGQELHTIKGHEGPIFSLAVSPDGKWLASSSQDLTVKLWAMATGDEVATFKGHSSAVAYVSFSPDSRGLISVGKEIKLWQITPGQEVLPDLPITQAGRHTGDITSGALSPDGKTIATSSYDRTIKLWNVGARSELATLKGHSSVVSCVAFSPDGRKLASGSRDKTVKLWDVAAGRELATFKGHAGDVYSVAFSPDGKRLASSSDDQTVKLWEVSTEQELISLKGHTGSVWSVAFSPDGKTLATGGNDRIVRLWRAATNEEVLEQKSKG